MHTDKKEGSSETLLFDSTNEFIPKAHTISLRVISELISRHCDTHALQQYTNIERDAHSPRSGIFSLLFWHFNYTCFNIFRLFKWMSSFRTNIRMGDKTHSFFITFLFFLLTGWTKASHWQWHCEHNFYWWWQLWLFTELHQKPIYTYPFHKLILSSLTAACFQLFSFHWKEKKRCFLCYDNGEKIDDLTMTNHFAKCNPNSSLLFEQCAPLSKICHWLKFPRVIQRPTHAWWISWIQFANMLKLSI